MKSKKMLAIINAGNISNLDSSSETVRDGHIRYSEETSKCATKLLQFFSSSASSDERIELSSSEIPLLF